MRYTEAAKPYVEKKLTLAKVAWQKGEKQVAFTFLEDAHVIGQQSTYYHTMVHYHMLQHGIRTRDIKEIIGQIIRLIGALTKTAIGLLPVGNTGCANVSAFRPLPISKENRKILGKIRDAQS